MHRALILSLSLLFPTTAHTQELQLKTIPPGESRIVSLEKDQPAPFDGHLYDNDTALRWANWLKQSKMLYRIDLSASEERRKLEGKICAQRMNLKQEQYNEMVAGYSQRLRKLEEERRNPPWYETVWFGATVGAATTLAVGITSIWAVGQLK